MIFEEEDLSFLKSKILSDTRNNLVKVVKEELDQFLFKGYESISTDSKIVIDLNTYLPDPFLAYCKDYILFVSFFVNLENNYEIGMISYDMILDETYARTSYKLIKDLVLDIDYLSGMVEDEKFKEERRLKINKKRSIKGVRKFNL